MSKKTEVVDWVVKLAQGGTQMRWTNVDNLSSLTTWARGSNERSTLPIPVMAPETTLVCFELPLLSAVSCGAITPLNLLSLYKKNQVDHVPWSKILNGYWVSSKTGYSVNTHSPPPEKGDLVFFNDMNHVALATGKKRASGNVEVVSFWGFSPIPTPGGQMWVLTPITMDTIEALAKLMPGEATVEFATPPW